MNFFTDNYIKENLFFLINECMKIALRKRDKETKKKKDGSLITIADKEIHNLIFKKLSKLYPKIPIISEEGKFESNFFLNKVYWLVDPIDGTSSYAAGKSGYTVNIALIKDGFPALGIIANPPTNTIWYGDNKNALVSISGNEKKISVRKFNEGSLDVIMSKNYDLLTKEFVNKINNVNIKYYSSSIKFCKLAEGEGDLYPRLHSINKWDIGAGDAILRSAGGVVFNENGKEMLYNSPGANTGYFFALSSKKIWYNLKKSNLF
ncbi:MAG: hypothetical protein CBB97_25420 [Candidatus Endolissoclinum sp. TMED37]|nr:MAG: hypothetical protein CBB97_25420 [Candidatus Endolissoclinum sp. TMED37]